MQVYTAYTLTHSHSHTYTHTHSHTHTHTHTCTHTHIHVQCTHDCVIFRCTKWREIFRTQNLRQKKKNQAVLLPLSVSIHNIGYTEWFHFNKRITSNKSHSPIIPPAQPAGQQPNIRFLLSLLSPTTRDTRKRESYLVLDWSAITNYSSQNLPLSFLANIRMLNLVSQFVVPVNHSETR